MQKKIRKVVVVGTGTLGVQIAILAACSGYEVSVYDINPDSFTKAYQNLKTFLRTSREKPMLPPEDWERGAEKVKISRELEEALLHADIVIEAVPENLEIKREVFARLDALAPKEAILATNSSSIPVSRIESATTRPERCLNIHFYSPAMGLNMADIMGGTRTAAEIVEAGRAWIRSLGCIPLTVKREIPGFCFNRIWRAVKREALFLWAEGFVDFRDIDRAWMIFTGMSQGPFGLMDAVGLDVVHGIEMVYYNESKDPKDRPPAPLKAMVDRNELGVKTGRGFYTYPHPEFRRPDFLVAPAEGDKPKPRSGR